jgi:hypothetical protein
MVPRGKALLKEGNKSDKIDARKLQRVKPGCYAQLSGYHVGQASSG